MKFDYLEKIFFVKVQNNYISINGQGKCIFVTCLLDIYVNFCEKNGQKLQNI